MPLRAATRICTLIRRGCSVAKIPDWNAPVETTPEQDQWSAAMAPPHLKAHYAERAALDPETRRLDLEARRAEAEAKKVAEIAAMTEKVIEQRKIEERIEEKQIEKEKVRQRKQDAPPLADPNSIQLEFAMSTDTATVKIEYLLDP